MTLMEQIARRLYADDNDGENWDAADEDARSPYYDLAEIAVDEIGGAA